MKSYEHFEKLTPPRYREIQGEERSDPESQRRVMIYKDMIQEAECNVFITMLLLAGSLANWPQRCKWSPRRIQGLGVKDIKKVLWADRDYAPYIDLLNRVRCDLAGNTTPSTTLLTVLHRKDYFLPTFNFPSRGFLENGWGGRVWILVLNEGFRGGKIFFPTRRHVFDPKQGSVLLFPVSLPFGISPVKGDMNVVIGASAYDVKEEDWNPEHWISS